MRTIMRATIYVTACAIAALGCESAQDCPCDDLDLDALTEFTNDTGCPCPGELVWCDGTCIDVMADDALNCGACGRECPYDHGCSEGECVCLADGFTSCDGTCVRLGTDTFNCGSCGNACGLGAPDCRGGECTCGGGAPCTVCDSLDDCETLDASGGTVPTCGWCIGGECLSVQWDGICGPHAEVCRDGYECTYSVDEDRCVWGCESI